VRADEGLPLLTESACARGAALGRAAATPSAALEAWMGSYGHRENLLGEAVTEPGVGCVRDGDAMLCSQVFLGP